MEEEDLHHRVQKTMMTSLTPKRLINLIGDTPLVDVSSMLDAPVRLYAKCEFMNPGLSMKDRMIKYILLKAEQEKKLRPGYTVICASSGNTGLSVAMLGAVKGYNVIVVTSEKCSVEKQDHIRAFNAKLLVTNEDEYVNYAGYLAKKHGYFDINQYDNPDNPQAYYSTLGPEIWKQSCGTISCLVMTSSTFGCISGTARFLKEQNRDIQVILADPLHSCLSDRYRQYRKLPAKNVFKKEYIIEGAGKTEPTSCTDFSLIDDVIDVSDKEAVACCKQLATKEGFFVGGSSGLNLAACLKMSKRLDKGIIVTILCDNGVKYLSKIYNPAFLQEHRIEA